MAACGKATYNYTDSSPKPIVWDSTSLQRVSEPNVYSGYARLIQLQDNSLFLVYGSSGGIWRKRSHDHGKTWSEQQLILPNTSLLSGNYADNAEVHQLKDGSILVWTNLRIPTGNTDTTLRLKIGLMKSIDNGNSWSPLKILYTAGWRWEEGCWEPKSIQLPSGEVQVYFANEFPYKGNDQSQEISFLSSLDNGETWTTVPKTACYRHNFRDGMPAPVVLKNGKEIAMAIEDNGYDFSFKPSIVRTKLSDNWSTPVFANSPNREFALKEILPVKIGPGSGAPYLAQLASGQTLLTCQSRYKRPDAGLSDNSVPLVAVGDEEARNFTHFSQPFSIPADKHGFWNSVATLSNGDIIVLTTTNAYSDNEQVWMIKGRLKQ